MTSNAVKLLYWSGTMLDSDQNIDTQIAQTVSSGFNTVLLWALHIVSKTEGKRTLGDLYWNDTPLVAVINGEPVFDPDNQFIKLKDRLSSLQIINSGKNAILFSIGAGGVPDFTTVQQLLSTPQGTKLLTANFGTLVKYLPMISGFDFDDEDHMDVDTIADFTQLLVDNFSSAITYCPYSGIDFWESCLQKVYKNMLKQPVAWWNLQCYSGGAGNNPQDWKNEIQNNLKENGVGDASAFIVPGYAAVGNDGGGECPAGICQIFSGLQGNVGGGFLWNSQRLFGNTSQCNNAIPTINNYAAAIEKGLSGKC